MTYSPLLRRNSLDSSFMGSAIFPGLYMYSQEGPESYPSKQVARYSLDSKEGGKPDLEASYRAPERRKSLGLSKSGLPDPIKAVVDNKDLANVINEDAAKVAEQTFVISSLAVRLLMYLGFGYRWMLRLAGLLMYITFLLPGFLQVMRYYFFSEGVVRSVEYGPLPRNRLDIFLPKDKEKPRPVVIFLTGGAWIIGYKAWGALLGQSLAERGVVVACVDYRNFPQGRVRNMVVDVTAGIDWIIQNIECWGGDPTQIYLVGQSAGAHLGATALLQQALLESKNDKALAWSPQRIQAFVGVSGGYDLVGLVDHFDGRGLPRKVFVDLMGGKASLVLHSPKEIVESPAFSSDNRKAASLLPPFTILHGTADRSIPWEFSEAFARSLERAGLQVKTKFYPGKTHTDPIIQDPMRGGKDELLEDILSIVRSDHESVAKEDAETPVRSRMVPEVLIRLASYVVPF